MQTLKQLIITSLLALEALCFFNCGSSRPGLGERLKVADSGEQPQWVKNAKDSWENKERIYFRTYIMDQSDLSMGMEALKAKAIKEVAEKVAVKISSDLAFAEEGNSGLHGYSSRYLQSGVAAQTDKLKLTGFMADESYWERYTVGKTEGVEYAYDIYRSFALRRSDYEEAKEAVLTQGRKEAENAHDIKAVEEINKLMERNIGTNE